MPCPSNNSFWSENLRKTENYKWCWLHLLLCSESIMIRMLIAWSCWWCVPVIRSCKLWIFHEVSLYLGRDRESTWASSYTPLVTPATTTTTTVVAPFFSPCSLIQSDWFTASRNLAAVICKKNGYFHCDDGIQTWILNDFAHLFDGVLVEWIQ